MTYLIDMPELRKIQKSGKAKLVIKKVPAYWRYTTHEDWETGLVSKGLGLAPIPGKIISLERVQDLSDIVCMNPDGDMWPMDLSDLHKGKRIVKISDKPGWQLYYSTEPRWALQIKEDFVVTAGRENEPLPQKAGGYLMFERDWAWAFAEALFKDYYEPVIAIEDYRDEHFVGLATSKTSGQKHNVFQFVKRTAILCTDKKIISGNAGDWLFDEGGSQYIVSQTDFLASYRHSK